MESGNTSDAFNNGDGPDGKYTYTITVQPNTTAGVIRFHCPNFGIGDDNSGHVAWITNVQVSSQNIFEQTEGQPIFDVTEGNKLNIMRIKGGTGIDITSE